MYACRLCSSCPRRIPPEKSEGTILSEKKKFQHYHPHSKEWYKRERDDTFVFSSGVIMCTLHRHKCVVVLVMSPRRDELSWGHHCFFFDLWLLLYFLSMDVFFVCWVEGVKQAFFVVVIRRVFQYCYGGFIADAPEIISTRIRFV